MVHRTYYGLGPVDVAVSEFELLTPYVTDLVALRRECQPLSLDKKAEQIAIDGIQTAAFHFTRIADFYGARGDSAGSLRASS
jgi:hypothetical protein